MKRAAMALLGTLALACSAQPRMVERELADVGRIDVPASLKAERYLGYDSERMNRLSFAFTATRWLTWPGGPIRYRQLLLVSVMAADAPDAEYATRPQGMTVSYEKIAKGSARPLGSGRLSTSEGLYHLDGEYRPAVEYLYVDKARRLQIAWHAVRTELDDATATAVLSGMASSFRLTNDPVAAMAEARAEPARLAQVQARRRATAQALLQREVGQAPKSGQPLLHKGALLEWMVEPEPRYQLLVPLGRVRAAAPGDVLNRPRPLARATGVGWRAFVDGQWVYSNADHAYLPMPGIAAQLAARQQDPGWVYFYVAATVRVEQAEDDQRLTSLDWFFNGLPEVQRRWRQGQLAGPGKPEAE